MDFIVLIIIGVAVFNLFKAQKAPKGKNPAAGKASQTAETLRDTFAQIRTEIENEGRTQMQKTFSGEMKHLFGDGSVPAPSAAVQTEDHVGASAASAAQQTDSVVRPRVAVSMDSRLHDPVQLKMNIDHSHPAAAASVRAEYVPVSGSLHEEAAAAGEVEGCEELQNIRLVRVDHPASVEQARIDPKNVVQGIVWSQVLGKRGGRRAL